MVEDSTFIVVMDFSRAATGKMPRQFYRALEKLQGVQRLQKSVYTVTGVSSVKELVGLAKGCGFDVQAFEVVNNGHTALTGEKK